jgi:hypothetical protein
MSSQSPHKGAISRIPDLTTDHSERQTETETKGGGRGGRDLYETVATTRDDSILRRREDCIEDCPLMSDIESLRRQQNESQRERERERESMRKQG